MRPQAVTISSVHAEPFGLSSLVLQSSEENDVYLVLQSSEHVNSPSVHGKVVNPVPIEHEASAIGKLSFHPVRDERLHHLSRLVNHKPLRLNCTFV
jgi:hypothetical protein